MTRRQKAIYDKKYRKRNRERIRRNHTEYFQRTYDPEKAAVERKKRMPYHVRYCRQPWYRKYKREYDRKRRERRFGAFADAYKVLGELVKEIRKQMPDRFERYAQSGRQQWNPINQERRRRKLYDWNGTVGC